MTKSLPYNQADEW